MLGIPRSARFMLILLLVIVLPSLYLLYPHHDAATSPNEQVTAYEAGGIDSDHWNKPVKPDFEREEARWTSEEDEAIEVAAPAETTVGDLSGLRSGGRRPHSDELVVEEAVFGGDVIMPKLENATAKAELGRAAWKVLHLMTLRYPDNPTDDDRQALKSYFHLFARLYPCGDCASHFQKLLKEYPPQTSSRKSASLWLCHVHNMVNERLGKPEFDCLTLDSTYDCGCGASSSATAISAVETKRAEEEAVAVEAADEENCADEMCSAAR